MTFYKRPNPESFGKKVHGVRQQTLSIQMATTSTTMELPLNTNYQIIKQSYELRHFSIEVNKEKMF